MKKLLLYGGTFDPPHIGHYELLRQTVRRTRFDKIIVMPTAMPPHKEAKHFLSDETRLAAVKLLFETIRGVKVSDLEMRRGGKSYSIDTLRYLSEQYPDHEISMLMGSDMFLSFEKWRRFEEILSLCTLITAPRHPGEREALCRRRDELVGRYGARCIVLDLPVVDLSSTGVRAGEKDGLPLEVRYLLYGETALEPLIRHLSETLTEQKYEHTLRVAEYCAALAARFGEDERKARLAGLLHDITKCRNKAWQLRYMQQKRVKLSVSDRKAPQIFHQITAPYFAAENFNVRDRSILHALGCHTTGRAHMSKLDKILFLADGIEPGRDYDGVGTIRRTAEKDLDRAALMYCDRSIHYIVDRGFFLHPDTVSARNDLLRKIYSEDKASGKK